MFHSALCPRGETAQCPVCVIMAFKHVMKLVVWIPNSGLSFFSTLLEHSVIHVCSLPFYETPHNDDNRLCGSARTRTLCVAAIKLQIKETSHVFFFFFQKGISGYFSRAVCSTYESRDRKPTGTHRAYWPLFHVSLRALVCLFNIASLRRHGNTSISIATITGRGEC